MKVIVFSAHDYEKPYFSELNTVNNHELFFVYNNLNLESAIMAKGFDCVCAFVNDKLDAEILVKLKEIGIKLIALRSAGFNHVNLNAAFELNLPIVRVPAYSPHAIAEHGVALLLTLNRKIHKAYNRSKEFNFSLEGLVGFDLHGKTVGIVGTGKIGLEMAKIMHGFGCQILAYDKYPNTSLNYMQFVSLDEIYKKCDIISLHIPLTNDTHHLINESAFSCMKKNAIIINTSRGGIIDTKALIEALKTKTIKGAALDVYEEEENYFFSDFSGKGIDDDNLARLLTFPNVIVTGHQGFLTAEAIHNIVETTLNNISDFENKLPLINEVKIQKNNF
ncbi:2-hydroxyacid dehydrogenase [Pigmentibacter sp. JX0631]|uniref:2-hydroxyacid dehydrogenase n=1 Tax=Pigmentibacter sp. JX0631 TaxID=2976982 RepID=UPI002469302A|nr:2-hydroxyacid dehydrogenase [Pigmentibacter sp. JX0631]WGL59501.1 2-hydroxyacid dehydrogenase [Pigmentibacter sp. JX0631]